MKKDLTDILYKLYSEVTPDGRKLLDKLVNSIVFELECIRQSIDMDEHNSSPKDL